MHKRPSSSSAIGKQKACWLAWRSKVQLWNQTSANPIAAGWVSTSLTNTMSGHLAGSGATSVHTFNKAHKKWMEWETCFLWDKWTAVGLKWSLKCCPHHHHHHHHHPPCKILHHIRFATLFICHHTCQTGVSSVCPQHKEVWRFPTTHPYGPWIHSSLTTHTQQHNFLMQSLPTDVTQINVNRTPVSCCSLL